MNRYQVQTYNHTAREWVTQPTVYTSHTDAQRALMSGPECSARIVPVQTPPTREPDPSYLGFLRYLFDTGRLPESAR